MGWDGRAGEMNRMGWEGQVGRGDRRVGLAGGKEVEGLGVLGGGG